MSQNDPDPGPVTTVLPAARSGLIDQAYREFCQLQDRGEISDPDAFCERFPAVKSSLYQLIQAHCFLENNPSLVERAPRPETWPRLGEIFLGFRLQRILGEGSFARVYLAEETKLGDRRVAVKIAMGGQGEANVLGKIQHANIVPIYSIQEEHLSGLTVVCMPYLGSATLCNVLDAVDSMGKLAGSAKIILKAAADPDAPPDLPAPHPVLRHGNYPDGIRLIGAKLADALAHIHKLGICHRDLKPSNVLLSPAGNPMLLDFNLSTGIKEMAPRLAGTIPYMAPEQLRAIAQGCFDTSAPITDPRSDIFSLGVILYQLLTTEHPFGPVPAQMDHFEQCRLILERQRRGTVDVCERNPHVDHELGDIIRRCLEVAPEKRPGTAAELGRDLWKGLTLLGRTRRRIGRNRRLLAVVAGFFLAVGLAGTIVASRMEPYNERQLAAGIALYQQGKLSESLEHFKAAVDAKPDFAPAHFARGRAYLQMGEKEKDRKFYQDAIDDFTRANHLVPDGRALACIGYCLNRLGEPGEAEAYYRQAIEMGHPRAEVFNNLGYTLSTLGQKRLEDAKKNLDQAILLDSDLRAAYHNRALLVLEKVRGKLSPLKVNGQDVAPGDKARAAILQLLRPGIDDMEFVLKSGPSSPEIDFDAACLFAAQTRFDPQWNDRALKHLTQAIDQQVPLVNLADDPIFSALRNDNRFQELLVRQAPRNAPRPPTQRIVNPYQDVTP